MKRPISHSRWATRALRVAFLLVVVAGVALSFGSEPRADADTTPPELTALSVSPPSVDVTSGSADVTVTATITDDSSGVAYVGNHGLGSDSKIRFLSQSVALSVTGFFTHVSGDEYSATLTLPQGTETGTWTAVSVSLWDQAGNAIVLDATDLTNAGLGTSFDVTSTPPSYTIGISPTSDTINPGDSSSVDVTITPAGGFSSDVSLCLYGDGSGGAAPSGVTASGSWLVSHATYTATVTVATTADVSGSQSLFIGSCDKSVFSDEYTLTVTAPAATPDFALGLDQNEFTVLAGNTFTPTATITPDSGFSGTIGLYLKQTAGPDPPDGFSASGIWGTLTIPGSTSEQVPITVDPTVPPGDYSFDVGANAQGLSLTDKFQTVTVHVKASADGSGSMTASPTTVPIASSGNTIDLTYTAAAGGLFNGAVSVTIPDGWSAPSTTVDDPGYTTSAGGVVSVVGRTVTVSGVTMAGGDSFDILYGDGATSATAPIGAGAQSWLAAEQSTSGGALVGLASSPAVTVVAPDDGAGTLDTQTAVVGAGTSNTITFSFTADTGGLLGGAVTLVVPAGWSAPSVSGADPGYATADSGTLTVSGQTITVSGLTMSGGDTLNLTYGDVTGGGPGATAPAPTTGQTWQAQEKSSAGGTLTNLLVSPSIAVIGPPTVTSFTGTILSGAGALVGDSVDVFGTGFTNATDVAFGGVPADGFSVVDDSHLTATVPGTTSGTITVTSAGGTGTSPSLLKIIVAPQITSLSPPFAKPGAAVTVNGTGFTGATDLQFNGESAPFTLVSDTKITTAVPADATSGPLTVTNAADTATSDHDFGVVLPPELDSFAPDTGAIGSDVVLSGVQLSGTTSVKFNGKPATHFSVDDDFTITVTVPVGATSGPITLSNAAGSASSALLDPSVFTVIPAPTITSVSAPTGLPNDTITIKGAHLDLNVSDVKFNGVSSLSVAFVPPNIVTATVPAVVSHATTGKIAVTTDGGTVLSKASFVTLVAPAITSLSTSYVKAGTPVTLNGYGFTGTTAVKFNGTPAKFKITSDLAITATAPTGGTNGTISIANPRGSATSGAGVTFVAVPKIQTVSVAQGVAGDPVTITGSGYIGPVTVLFNTVAASITSSSSTVLHVLVPAGATTGKIAVSNLAGKATTAAAFTTTAIGSFSPAFAKVGTVITITGSHLAGATFVKFNGHTASFTPVSDTKLRATVPPGATTGPITVTGTLGVAPSATSFGVVVAPSISSFTPTSGKVGATVTITGNGLLGTTAVKFNGKVAKFTFSSNTSITAIVPKGATTGTISVTNPVATATSPGSFTVTT
jgi:hypothetical protein